MGAERVREFYRRQGEERELKRIIDAIAEYNELHGMPDYLFEELLLTVSPVVRTVKHEESEVKTEWQDEDKVTTTFGSIQSSLQQAHAAGIKTERARISELLKEQKVIRHCAATGLLVFVNCNTLEVLYLKDDLMNESAA